MDERIKKIQATNKHEKKQLASLMKADHVQDKKIKDCKKKKK